MNLTAQKGHSNFMGIFKGWFSWFKPLWNESVSDIKAWKCIQICPRKHPEIENPSPNFFLAASLASLVGTDNVGSTNSSLLYLAMSIAIYCALYFVLYCASHFVLCIVLYCVLHCVLNCARHLLDSGSRQTCSKRRTKNDDVTSWIDLIWIPSRLVFERTSMANSTTALSEIHAKARISSISVDAKMAVLRQ